MRASVIKGKKNDGSAALLPDGGVGVKTYTQRPSQRTAATFRGTFDSIPRLLVAAVPVGLGAGTTSGTFVVLAAKGFSDVASRGLTEACKFVGIHGLALTGDRWVIAATAMITEAMLAARIFK